MTTKLQAGKKLHLKLTHSTSVSRANLEHLFQPQLIGNIFILLQNMYFIVS